MAGGPNAASVMCILCAERADRTREGLETDGYTCTVCGGSFHINWDESQPSEPCWPPSPEAQAQMKAFFAARANTRRPS
jgi:hypothetical protein